MFQAIKDIGAFLKARDKNCSPLCSHCEVEVSENTAAAIARMLEKRIKEVPWDLALVSELKYQKDLILKGAWHEDYDTHYK